MGADRAIHVEIKGEDYEGLQPLAVSKILAKLIENEEVDIAFFGKQVRSDMLWVWFMGVVCYRRLMTILIKLDRW